MNRYLFISGILFLVIQFSHAQVGINTLDPKPSSALDIRSIEKGLLIPCMSSDNRLNIVNPADGLMVYDTIQNTFYYWDKTKAGWYAINPWSYRSPDSNGTSYNLYTLLNANIGIGRIDPQQKLHVAGSVKIDSSLYVQENVNVTGDITTNNITANALSGNGAGVTNVDADLLDGQHGTYYASNTRVNTVESTLQSTKLDRSLFSNNATRTDNVTTTNSKVQIVNSYNFYKRVEKTCFVNGSIAITTSANIASTEDINFFFVDLPASGRGTSFQASLVLTNATWSHIEARHQIDCYGWGNQMRARCYNGQFIGGNQHFILYYSYFYFIE